MAGAHHRAGAARHRRCLLVVPSGHQHSLHGLLGLRLHRYPAAAVPRFLDALQAVQDGHQGSDEERGQGEDLPHSVLRARGRGGARGHWRPYVHGDLPGQCREVFQRAEDRHAGVCPGHQGSELFGDSRHRPRFRHFAGQPRDGLHPRVRQPVRGVEPVLADQLPGHAGSREPLGLRRPVQVVHQPRGRHPGLRAREHDHPGRRDRASGRQPHLLLAVRAARAQHRPPRAVVLPLLHVRREVLRNR